MVLLPLVGHFFEIIIKRERASPPSSSPFLPLKDNFLQFPGFLYLLLGGVLPVELNLRYFPKDLPPQWFKVSIS